MKKQANIKDSLIELYLMLKPRKETKDLTTIEIEEEEEKLKSLTAITIINYIKNTIETIIQVLAEEKVQEYAENKNNSQQEYESMLIKLEKDIRGHIRTEHQLKLFAESLQNDIDDLERENERLIKRINAIEGQQNKIDSLKQENESISQILASYEEQNLKLCNNERKLKTLLVKREQEILKGEQKIKVLNKRVLSLENQIKNGNASSNNTMNNNKSPSSQDESISLNKTQNSSKLHSSNRQKSQSSSSNNGIDKYIHQKYQSNKNIYGNSNNGNMSSISREKSFNKKNNTSFLAQNDSMIISKKHDEFLKRMDFIPKKIFSEGTRSKKVCHNRHKSLEETAKYTQNKNSNMLKEMIFNQNYISKTSKKPKYSSAKKKPHFELVNNINIYTNTLKQDNRNVYVKASMASSGSNNSGKTYGEKNYNFVKVSKVKQRSISSRK